MQAGLRPGPQPVTRNSTRSAGARPTSKQPSNVAACGRWCSIRRSTGILLLSSRTRSTSSRPTSIPPAAANGTRSTSASASPRSARFGTGPRAPGPARHSSLGAFRRSTCRAAASRGPERWSSSAASSRSAPGSPRRSFRRIILRYNSMQRHPRHLARRLESLARPGLPRVEIDYASDLLGRNAGLPGLFDPSPIDLALLDRAAATRRGDAQFTVGRRRRGDEIRQPRCRILRRSRGAGSGSGSWGARCWRTLSVASRTSSCCRRGRRRWRNSCARWMSSSTAPTRRGRRPGARRLRGDGGRPASRRPRQRWLRADHPPRRERLRLPPRPRGARPRCDAASRAVALRARIGAAARQTATDLLGEEGYARFVEFFLR